MRRPLVIGLLLALPAVASAEPLKGWLGPKPHMYIQGRIAGEKLSYKLDGVSYTSFWCEREYIVPGAEGKGFDYAQGRHHEVKVQAVLGLSKKHHRVELELKRHDLQSDKPGTKVDIVRRPIEPLAGQMWLEWEWHADDARLTGEWENYEEPADKGHFELGEMTGERKIGGLVIPENTGTFGGYLEAKWKNGDHVKMSFTVRCTINRVADVYLSPP